MKHYFLLPVILIGTLLTGCLSTEIAQVKMENGKPCFTVSDKSQTRSHPVELAVVTVYKQEEGKVWFRPFPKNQPVFLSPDQCISYGEETEGAPELETNVVYSVSIGGFINGNSHTYQAYFCMVNNSSGQTDIIQLDREKRENNDWPICKK